jgi:acetyl-CoA carboxylase biotin carboxyl carrier protein
MNEKLILTIIDKFSSGSIGELDLSDGTYHLVLRKEQRGISAGAAQPLPAAGTGEAPAGENAVRLGIAANAGAEAGGGEKITSPIVATFYASPSPDAPAFVKPGSKVKAGETLCILEAMKMMNHLEAEFDCEIIETHVSSGDLVEYGQALFTVRQL